MTKTVNKFTSYPEAVRYLYALQARGMKFGLRGIRALLHELGNPQQGFKSVHIAGTNGKGSVAAMIAAMTTAGGIKTGLYTSPHIVDFSERIRINGRPIPRKDFLAILNRIVPVIETERTTFFETVTAIAFEYFDRERVDLAVLETGLGGRLDATNVVKPLVSIITSIGLDHTELLGKTIQAIAQEKAGIIKRRVPIVCGVIQPEARNVIERIADQKESKFYSLDHYRIERKEGSLNFMRMDVVGPDLKLKDVKVSLGGRIQTRNVVMACLTLNIIKKQIPVATEAQFSGLKDINRWTGFYGRLSKIRETPPVFIDVSHNAPAIAIIAEDLAREGVKNAIAVFGLMKDKQLGSMRRSIARFAGTVICVRAATERSRDPVDLAKAIEKHGNSVFAMQSVPDGVRKALSLSKGKQPIVILGSHFVVGEAMAYLKGMKYLTISQ